MSVAEVATSNVEELVVMSDTDVILESSNELVILRTVETKPSLDVDSAARDSVEEIVVEPKTLLCRSVSSLVGSVVDTVSELKSLVVITLSVLVGIKSVVDGTLESTDKVVSTVFEKLVVVIVVDGIEVASRIFVTAGRSSVEVVSPVRESSTDVDVEPVEVGSSTFVTSGKSIVEVEIPVTESKADVKDMSGVVVDTVLGISGMNTEEESNVVGVLTKPAETVVDKSKDDVRERSGIEVGILGRSLEDN